MSYIIHNTPVQLLGIWRTDIQKLQVVTWNYHLKCFELPSVYLFDTHADNTSQLSAGLLPSDITVISRYYSNIDVNTRWDLYYKYIPGLIFPFPTTLYANIIDNNGYTINIHIVLLRIHNINGKHPLISNNLYDTMTHNIPISNYNKVENYKIYASWDLSQIIVGELYEHIWIQYMKIFNKNYTHNSIDKVNDFYNNILNKQLSYSNCSDDSLKNQIYCIQCYTESSDKNNPTHCNDCIKEIDAGIYPFN